jgi:hypothetical protein
LRKMPFNPPHNMRGRLDYVFAVVERQVVSH